MIGQNIEEYNYRSSTTYNISIVLKHKKERTLVDITNNTFIFTASELWYKSAPKNNPKISTKIIFPYIFFRGVYLIQFNVCDEKGGQPENDDSDKR